jgi:hypothetical protein
VRHGRAQSCRFQRSSLIEVRINHLEHTAETVSSPPLLTRTGSEPFATILLPNSVARSRMSQDKPVQQWRLTADFQDCLGRGGAGQDGNLVKKWATLAALIAAGVLHLAY